MFAFKRLKIVNDSGQNHAMTRIYNQVWCALREAASVAFEILVKKLRVEDTEGY